MGDIGTERREVEFEPLTEDPVPVPATARPRAGPHPRPGAEPDMVDEVPAGVGAALVPGELRGYRQFLLCKDDGLYPLVHTVCGPWDGQLQRAVCASGARHAAPAPDCLCGLYAWYLPGSATVSLGPASAVVAARGRCVLGDRGFRAAAARIEAVVPAGRGALAPRGRSAGPRDAGPALSADPGLPLDPADAAGPPAAGRQRPGDSPPRDHSRAYRAAAAVLWVAFVLARSPRGRLPRAASPRPPPTGGRCWCC